jgi:perosamine synthetase
MLRIPVAGPSITQKEIDYVTDAVTNAWYGRANMYHERFEKAFAAHAGRRHAMALPSCTSGLHLVLLGLGLGPGDEVIVPDATWIATAAPISYVGATPVFADIDADSWCLSAESFVERITSRTKAVIVVDLYGNMPDMDEIQRVADRHGVAVIEDAAEAAGSEYDGRPAGSFGRASVFSFHGSKTLTTGEGGMLLTDDDELFARCLFLRDHGRAPGDTWFWNTEVAYKYKMSSLQAALGLAQLERIGDLVERKRRIFSWYRDELQGLEGVTLNQEATNVKNTYWMVTVVLDQDLGVSKADLSAALAENRIDCRPFFHPLSSLPAYEGRPQAREARERNNTAYWICPNGLNLPSALILTRDDVARVGECVRQVVRAPSAARGRLRRDGRHASPSALLNPSATAEPAR